jgi:hypothetical protein
MSTLIINGEDIKDYFYKTYDSGSNIEKVLVTTDTDIKDDSWRDNDWQELLGFGYDDVVTDWMTTPNKIKFKDVTMALVLFNCGLRVRFDVGILITADRTHSINIY